jgi:hypothetical protein
MNTKMLKLCRKLWSSPTVPSELNRANARKWVKSIRLLGDKWLLAKHVGRV